MRKITREAAEAFCRRKPLSKSNTTVTVTDDAVAMYLHGNLIAVQNLHDASYILTVTDAGWRTATTKERLNGLLRTVFPLSEVFIYQKDYNWYIHQQGDDYEMGYKTLIRLDAGVVSE